ncbi:hypothetical protein HUJ05_004269 [Dendroctonus ponderosae]|nr:hypothetical protein HUJ05_004269 [Dendroctonus ponderosae]
MQSFSNLFHLNQQAVSHHHADQMTPPQHNRHLAYLATSNYHQHMNNFSHYQPTPSPSISIESCPETPSDESSENQSSKSDCSSSPKENFFKRHTGHHHHHSIQELIGHFRKKVHNWRAENGYRRSSCSESASNEGDEFRERSKSLDCNTKRPSVTHDCESTYRIYNTILKEGAQIKQKVLDGDRRRQSLGAIIPTNIHRASDAFVDPHHAAILFRDSRGQGIGEALDMESDSEIA